MGFVLRVCFLLAFGGLTCLVFPKTTRQPSKRPYVSKYVSVVATNKDKVPVVAQLRSPTKWFEPGELIVTEKQRSRSVIVARSAFEANPFFDFTAVQLRESSLLFLVGEMQSQYSVTRIWGFDRRTHELTKLLEVTLGETDKLKEGIVIERKSAHYEYEDAEPNRYIERTWSYDEALGRFEAGEWRKSKYQL